MSATDLKHIQNTTCNDTDELFQHRVSLARQLHGLRIPDSSWTTVTKWILHRPRHPVFDRRRS